MFKLGTLKIPHKKHTAGMKAERIATPGSVVLPLSQFIGTPATPIVKVGDKVCVGSKVAEANGQISASIHSPVSGTVKKIGDFLLSSGKSCQAITIESDGEMTVDSGITPPVVSNSQELCQAIRESGLVGLGGAGFPAASKLETAIAGQVDTVIINGAECEPFITADNRTMTEGGKYVARGIEIIEKHIPTCQKIIVAVEKNKPVAISNMKELLSANSKVEVVELPVTYPQGSENVLVYNTTGRVVPEGKIPTDVGCVMFNVTTVAYLAYYLETGMPLIWKTFTVDGSAVKSPKIVTAPIGTSIKEVLEFADVDFEDLGKVVYGGPMMGVAVYSLEDPVLKNTNAIVAFNKKDSSPKKQHPCVHCGRCIAVCPMKLNPTAFVKAMKIDDKEERANALEKANVLSCIDCGSCSYICPSRRPLVENNKLAKNDLCATRNSNEN